MNSSTSTGIWLFLSFCAGSFPLGYEQFPETPVAKMNRQPVVVELFTSEGCSTCPPADTLLVKFEEEQPFAGTEIIAMEEHVDYWNQQGWMDPFSSNEWTQRQQDYADKFKQGSTYTPEMVVEGQSGFVGTRLDEAQKAIAAAAQRPKTEVVISDLKSHGDGAKQFAVSVSKLAGNTAGDSAEVWVAVTEKGLHSAVKAGENAGAELHHASVVRTLRKIGTADAGKEAMSFSGEPIVKVKSSWNAQNVRVVVFVQEKKSRRILGAASASL